MNQNRKFSTATYCVFLALTSIALHFDATSQEVESLFTYRTDTPTLVQALGLEREEVFPGDVEGPHEVQGTLLKVNEALEEALANPDFAQTLKLPVGEGKVADFSVIALPTRETPVAAVTFNGTSESQLDFPQPKMLSANSLTGNDFAVLTILNNQLHIVVATEGMTFYAAPVRNTIDPDATHLLTELALPSASQDSYCNVDEVEFNIGAMSALPLLDKKSLLEQIPFTKFTATLRLDVGNDVVVKHFKGDPAKAGEYAVGLFDGVKAIYKRDLDVDLELAKLVVWTSPDGFDGGDSKVQLEKYAKFGRGVEDGGDYTLFHLLKATDGLGGIAYLNALCRRDIGYGVSNIDATYNGESAAYVWDLDVLAHELGHNFGSPHTHCYPEPLDCCSTSGCSNCGSSKPTLGTIMSYCHLTSAGKQLRFHEATRKMIQDFIMSSSCGQH